MTNRICAIIGLLFFVAVPATAQVQFELTPDTLSGSPGTVITFSGVLRNLGASDVFLNTDDYNFDAAGLDLNDSKYFINAPSSLPVNGSWSGEMFDINIDPSASPGPYAGSFSILGGADVLTFDTLATTNFQVNVQNPPAVPELSTQAVFSLGIVLLTGLEIRRRRGGLG